MDPVDALSRRRRAALAAVVALLVAWFVLAVVELVAAVPAAGAAADAAFALLFVAGFAAVVGYGPRTRATPVAAALVAVGGWATLLPTAFPGLPVPSDVVIPASYVALVLGLGLSFYRQSGDGRDATSD